MCHKFLSDKKNAVHSAMKDNIELHGYVSVMSCKNRSTARRLLCSQCVIFSLNPILMKDFPIEYRILDMLRVNTQNNASRGLSLNWQNVWKRSSKDKIVSENAFISFSFFLQQDNIFVQCKILSSRII